MIQPAFMFMVGVAMPFSYGKRREAGEDLGRQVRHVAWRTFVLLIIGLVIVTKPGAGRTTFMFTNVLAQIALGYPFLFLLSLTSERSQWMAVGLIAISYWMLFATYPPPAAGFDYAQVGVRPGMLDAVTLPGFFAHWNMGTNVGADFDRWFLNLFPREKPFAYNPGGVRHAQFRALAHHDDAWLDVGCPTAARGLAAGQAPLDAIDRTELHVGRMPCGDHGVSRGETDLDTLMGLLQRRDRHLPARLLLLPGGSARLEALGVSPCGGRREFHRRLPDGHLLS